MESLTKTGLLSQTKYYIYLMAFRWKRHTTSLWWRPEHSPCIKNKLPLPLSHLEYDLTASPTCYQHGALGKHVWWDPKVFHQLWSERRGKCVGPWPMSKWAEAKQETSGRPSANRCRKKISGHELEFSLPSLFDEAFGTSRWAVALVPAAHESK